MIDIINHNFFKKKYNLKSKNKINFFNIGLNIKDLFFFSKQIMSGKSFMRATHNLFLKKNLKFKDLTADLGSGKKNDYSKLIFKNYKLINNYDFFKKGYFTKKLNLEKKFKLKSKYKNIILFNVLEHIYNKDILINSINKSLQLNGRLELFVPFMYKFHGDPNDYARYTHVFLSRFLKDNGFKVKTTLIGVGQISVINEIILKYVKISLLKVIISIILSLINKIFFYISKDFKNYYCGIHCSCIKIK